MKGNIMGRKRNYDRYKKIEFIRSGKLGTVYDVRPPIEHPP